MTLCLTAARDHRGEVRRCRLEATVLEGAMVETVFVSGGSVTIDAGTTVTGDVRTLDSTVALIPRRSVVGLGVNADLIAATAVIAPILLFLLVRLVTSSLVSRWRLPRIAFAPPRRSSPRTR
jgi:hypothetical protein